MAGTLEDEHARRSVPAVKSALVAAPLDVASWRGALAQGAGAGPTGEQDLQLAEQLGLGATPARLMPRSARTVTTAGLRTSPGSVPAESGPDPGGLVGVVGADKQHLPLASGRCHGGVSWLAAWVGCPPWVWRVQVWAAIWTASQGLPNGGV